MSSRSFRRRNNRRRQRPAPGADEQGKPQEGPQEKGPSLERQQRGRPKPQGQAASQRGGGQRRDSPQMPGGRQPSGKATEQRPQRPEVPLVIPDCPVCGKPVRELSSALTHRASRQPAHFDCVMRELRDSNEIAPQEKLYYLGGGSFGILELRPPGGPSRFVIRKRIQYEEKEVQQEWKKPLQIQC